MEKAVICSQVPFFLHSNCNKDISHKQSISEHRKHGKGWIVKSLSSTDIHGRWTTAIVYTCHSSPIGRAHLPWLEGAIKNTHSCSHHASQFQFSARKDRWPNNSVKNIWSWWCGQRVIDVALLKDREIFNWLDSVCNSEWTSINLIPTE